MFLLLVVVQVRLQLLGQPLILAVRGLLIVGEPVELYYFILIWIHFIKLLIWIPSITLNKFQYNFHLYNITFH